MSYRLTFSLAVTKFKRVLSHSDLQIIGKYGFFHRNPLSCYMIYISNIESYIHLFWKRLLRSTSPIIDPTLPSLPLNCASSMHLLITSRDGDFTGWPLPVLKCW